jgi:hypothetical protein
MTSSASGCGPTDKLRWTAEARQEMTFEDSKLYCKHAGSRTLSSVCLAHSITEQFMNNYNRGPATLTSLSRLLSVSPLISSLVPINSFRLLIVIEITAQDLSQVFDLPHVAIEIRMRIQFLQILRE